MPLLDELLGGQSSYPFWRESIDAMVNRSPLEEEDPEGEINFPYFSIPGFHGPEIEGTRGSEIEGTEGPDITPEVTAPDITPKVTAPDITPKLVTPKVGIDLPEYGFTYDPSLGQPLPEFGGVEGVDLGKLPSAPDLGKLPEGTVNIPELGFTFDPSLGQPLDLGQFDTGLDLGKLELPFKYPDLFTGELDLGQYGEWGEVVEKAAPGFKFEDGNVTFKPTNEQLIDVSKKVAEVFERSPNEPIQKLGEVLDDFSGIAGDVLGAISKFAPLMDFVNKFSYATSGEWMENLRKRNYAEHRMNMARQLSEKPQQFKQGYPSAIEHVGKTGELQHDWGDKSTQQVFDDIYMPAFSSFYRNAPTEMVDEFLGGLSNDFYKGLINGGHEGLAKNIAGAYKDNNFIADIDWTLQKRDNPLAVQNEAAYKKYGWYMPQEL